MLLLLASSNKTDDLDERYTYTLENGMEAVSHIDQIFFLIFWDEMKFKIEEGVVAACLVKRIKVFETPLPIFWWWVTCQDKNG